VTLSAQIDGQSMVPAAISFTLHLPPEIEFGNIFLNPRPKEMQLTKSRLSLSLTLRLSFQLVAPFARVKPRGFCGANCAT